MLSLHPNYTTFLLWDKNYFNTSQNISFSPEEITNLKEIFDDEKPDNSLQNSTLGNTTNIGHKWEEELAPFIQKDFFLFGMAITRPFVWKFIGIGFGATTIWISIITWLACLCCGGKNTEEEEETPKIKDKKNR